MNNRDIKLLHKLMMKKHNNLFNKIIDIEQLFDAWYSFRKGKRQRYDVQHFERRLEEALFKLHRELKSRNYKHGSYDSFYVFDPKVRHIRKARVKDRLVHQALHTVLCEIYEPKFVYHLYSSRVGKGTHRAVNALREMTWKVSKNNTLSCFGLKCDVKKFYDTVDHEVLLNIIKKTVRDQDTLWLIEEVIRSYHLEGTPNKGMPIGNLTSQIFTNIYLNELDQFIKHKLKVKYYLRYADDLMLLSEDKGFLNSLIPEIENFLEHKLLLQLHPNKIELRPHSQGLDFLGYVTLPYHRVLRTKTQRRMKRKLTKRLNDYFNEDINIESMNQTMQSYLGILFHGNLHSLTQELKNNYFWT